MPSNTPIETPPGTISLVLNHTDDRLRMVVEDQGELEEAHPRRQPLRAKVTGVETSKSRPIRANELV